MKTQIETREELIIYIKRQLGSPVVDIEMTDEQIEDVIDEVIELYSEFSENGQVHEIMRTQLFTQTHKNPFKVKLPKDVFTVSKVYHDEPGIFNPFLSFTPGNTHLFGGSMYNYMWQSYSFDIVSYQILQDFLGTLEQYRNNKLLYEFNRNTQFLTIFTPSKMKTPLNLFIEIYKYLDPEKYPLVYNRRWFKRACVAKARILWGNNLHKFGSLEMDSGWKIEPRNLIEQGEKEWEALEEQLRDELQDPPAFFIN